MDENLIKNEWYTGQRCACGGQIWHFKGEINYRCKKCNMQYNVKEEEIKSKEGFLMKVKKIWQKTVFPEMIEKRKKRKKVERKRKAEEKEVVDEVRSEARKEALKELKPALKEKIKQQELKKLTGEDKKEKMEKFANAFKLGGSDGGSNKYVDMIGMGVGNVGGDDKIKRMLGGTGSAGGGIGDDKIKRILGGAGKSDKVSGDDKIKRMLGGMGGSNIGDDEHIKKMMGSKGSKKGKKKPKKQVDNFDERMKRMLS